jgi:predicted Zn-dependent protease
MKKRLSLLALGLIVAGPAWALDPTAQKLADRYLGILQGNPAQQTALDRLWKIHHDAGETEAFQELARRQAEAHPVLAATLLQKSGLDAEAERILQAAAEKGAAPAAEALAARLAARGDVTGAAAILEKAVAAAPSPELWIQLGLCRHRVGDSSGARGAWEEAVALSPRDLGLRRRLARACAAAGDRDAAVTHLQAVAEHGAPSERFEAWQEISRHLAAEGRWTDAIAAQESLLRLMGPGHWQLESARRRLFELHRQAGSLDAQEAAWRAAAEARPKDPEAALWLADYYDFAGRPADRLVWLRKAAELKPADVDLLREAASLELAAGRHAEAAALYDRALEARPGQADLVFLRAEVAALAGDEADAEKRVEDYLAAHPGDESATGRAQEFYRRLRLSAPLERKLTARLSAAPADESAALELARFYLDENRFAEATDALQRFDLSGRPPEKAADVAFRFSQILHQAHVDEPALVWARKAVELQPAKPEPALHLAELLVSGGESAEARQVLDQACSRTPLPREDLDRRLHFLVQDRLKTPTEKSSGEMGERVQRMLTRARDAEATEADWLRVARWLRWNGDPAGTVVALREAVKRFDSSETLRDALATALVEKGDTAGAIKELQILIERFPEHATAYRRRAGHLEFDRGNAEDGLRTFAALAASRPGEWQAVVDLALAEQSAGNWFKALETWQRAYSLAPPEARSGLRQPLLNAAARLQLHDRALDFLEAAATAEKDPAVREDLFREASAYAVQNQVVSHWRERVDRRIAETPEERHWEMAGVLLLEAEGRKAEARAALVDVQRHREESADVLTPLLKAAEKAEDWDEAARLTRRLMALSRQPDASLSIQLARFLEQANRRTEAAEAWTAVAALHGRDPAALTAAAEFFDRTGDEARMEACYRGAARFGTCAPQVLLRLGRHALERGDRFQALEDFTAVLNRVRPDPSTRDILPLPDLLAAQPAPPPAPRSAVPPGWRRPSGQPVPWPQPSETENAGCRLLAIREAGRLLANSPKKPDWLAQFTQPVERLWALYASGETAEAFDAVVKISVDPADREVTGQMYSALLLEAGDGDRLTRWASSDPAKLDARWDMVVAALVKLMEAGWLPGDLNVFAGAPPIKRWQFARVLASRHHYQAACALTEKIARELPEVVDANVFPAGAAWLEYARWKLALRDPDGAVEGLDRALSCTPPSAAFGSPFLAAVRARWLLTPKDLRPDFEKAILGKLEKSASPGGASASAALLAALRGEDAVADAALAKAFRELEESGELDWQTFVQQAGAQLEDWGLTRLARELYRRELARDRAWAALHGQDFRPQTEALLVANQIGWARREGLPYLLKEWLARGVGNEDMLRLAEALKKNGQSDRAALVLTALSEREPRDNAVMGGMLSFVDDPLTRPMAAAYVERRLAEPSSGASQTLVRNAAVRLAAQWEQAGEYRRCLELLDRMRDAGFSRRALALQRVRVLCQMGRHREALEEVETQARPLPPASPGLAVSLASLYAGFGRSEEARVVLEKEAATQSVDRSVAREKIREMFPENRRTANPADRLAALDREGVSRTERFRQGREFLLAEPDLPGAVRKTEMERLRRQAEREPQLLPEFYALRRELAGRSGETASLEAELEKEWDGGRGRREAGETLFLLNLEAKNFANISRLLDQSLNDRHYNESAWDQFGQLLLMANQPELSARVLSALIARAPGNANRALFLAEALWKSGHHTEARELVQPIERIAALDGSLRVDLARYELATGNVDGARRYLLALPGRPTEAAAALWSRVAAEVIAGKNIAGAREALERALAVPTTLSAQVLADFHAAAGDLATREPGTAELVLPPQLLRDFQIEVAIRLAAVDNTDQAWLWLEAAQRPLATPAGRDLLRTLEGFDPARAVRLWEAALDADATWEMQRAAAAFYLRRALAEVSPAARIATLKRAHELHPGSFAIADPLAKALLSEGRDAQARQVYRDLLDAFAETSDRNEAIKCLSALPGPLPPDGPLR